VFLCISTSVFVQASKPCQTLVERRSRESGKVEISQLLQTMSCLRIVDLSKDVLVLILERLPLFDRIRVQSTCKALCFAARHPRLFDIYVASAKLPWHLTEAASPAVVRRVSEQQQFLSSFKSRCVWIYCCFEFLFISFPISRFKLGNNVLELHSYMLFVLPPVDVVAMQTLMRENPMKCMFELFGATDDCLPVEEHLLLKSRLAPSRRSLSVMQSWQTQVLSWAASAGGMRLMYCGLVPFEFVGLYFLGGKEFQILF
jgi:hypothetical protein